MLHFFVHIALSCHHQVQEPAHSVMQCTLSCVMLCNFLLLLPNILSAFFLIFSEMEVNVGRRELSGLVQKRRNYIFIICSFNKRFLLDMIDEVVLQCAAVLYTTNSRYERLLRILRN